ncbi:hypothetical protein [Spirilliplanes yamanashiensis]|uniref:Uncharacterized protein n=1 Tax=Spirilliplanes yamanashiensis TaxID=42233 RepID=A0A8J4DMR3_9ACTN|nr:hypothetical protein [Spirilliplanes yamanashiensis]MDP9815295.1 hypothetical protein [Spirilliplanes yamanashiensis]GIJ06435.1 hypothetical protein Sya03_57870 [Spirilliplanes yamanashiensis]
MNKANYSERLAPAGLIFLGLMGRESPLVPPTLAALAPGYPPESGAWPRAVVGTDVPDFIAIANAGWFEISLRGGLVVDDREFLVAVEISEGDWWWAHVKLAECWDMMGAGSAAALGTGFGVPDFAMLSLAGDVIVCGTAGGDMIGAVVVNKFHDLTGLRELADWKAGWPGTPQQERHAARRWLESIDH